jgi:3-phenylpropionate/trans-cinnamate dioxygenase ferredoxin reductase subunit
LIINIKTYNYDYLIIGGGMAADSAARGIREADSEGTIGIIGKEDNPPYARPPLSKTLWKGEEKIADIDLKTSEIDVEFHLGKKVTKIDPAMKMVYDEKGNEFRYKKLLITTGGTPKEIPNVTEPGIIYFRTLSDYKKLHEIVDKKNSFGVVGGGFIGSEIAAGIKTYKPEAKVSIIFPEKGIGGLIFPEKLSNFLNDYYQEKGINVLAGELVTHITKKERTYLTEIKSGKKLEFDAIVAGLGITPNVGLLKGTNIKIDNGIIVNKYLQTSDENIFAAGDVVRYRVTALDSYVRVEHEDNAINMGYAAGQNMAGQATIYDNLSYFYSDLFDYGYEAVGVLDSRLKTKEVWKEPFEEGIVYYTQDNKVKGILLWNVWEKIDEARMIISDGKKLSLEDLESLIEF